MTLDPSKHATPRRSEAVTGIACYFGTLLLPRGRIRRAREERAPVLECHGRDVRRRRRVVRLPAFDDEHGADRQVFLAPAAAEQSIRAGHLERPVHDFAVVSGNV